MVRVKDLTGMQFDRLTVISQMESVNHKSRWLCECECGNSKEIIGGNLTSGKSRSCGCIRKEMLSEMQTTHGLSSDEEGKRTKLSQVWQGMKARCFNENNKSYPSYGGRGIVLCDEWLEYQPFYDWAMQNGYQEGLTIERINNDGNYEPTNCKWIPGALQHLNRQATVYVEYNGERLPAMEWDKRLNARPHTVRGRLDKGWSVERAVTEPVKKREET